MSPLHKRCSDLWDYGVDPTELINIARFLHLPEMLVKAFPDMPCTMRDDFMNGEIDIKLVDNVWSRVKWIPST